MKRQFIITYKHKIDIYGDTIEINEWHNDLTYDSREEAEERLKLIFESEDDYGLPHQIEEIFVR